MSRDWVTTARQLGELANQTEATVFQVLTDSNLTAAQAVQLHETVEEHALEFDRTLWEMERSKVDIALISVVEPLGRIWLRLSVTTTNSARKQLGLEPIIVPRGIE